MKLPTFKIAFPLFGRKPKPPKLIDPDEQPGILGDILRFGEAAGGNAQAAQAEQKIADSR